MRPFDKNVWKKYAKQYVITSRPDLFQLFSNKVIASSIDYMEGYSDCLIENVNPPKNKKDIERAIFDAGVKRAIAIMTNASQNG